MDTIVTIGNLVFILIVVGSLYLIARKIAFWFKKCPECDSRRKKIYEKMHVNQTYYMHEHKTVRVCCAQCSHLFREEDVRLEKQVDGEWAEID